MTQENYHAADPEPDLARREDPYGVLGLSPAANADEVRRAYFRLVRTFSPEAHPQEFKRVRSAYDTLRSPLRRAELALLAFDESAADFDLDLLVGAAHGHFDAAKVLLAVELSLSELARTDFTHDQSPIDEAELLGCHEPRPGMAP
jgi:curved DNA-binding protein CbpA